MRVVVDANVAFALTSAPGAIERVADDELVAPPLLWPEVRSALHVAASRGLMTDEDARTALGILESDAIRERRHAALGREAWAIADSLGWNKTYDAEYLALAALLKAPIVTFDRRVERAADRLSIPATTRLGP